MPRTKKFRKNKDFLELEPDLGLPIYFDDSLREEMRNARPAEAILKYYNNSSPLGKERYARQARQEKTVLLNEKHATQWNISKNIEIQEFIVWAFRLKYSGGYRVLANYTEAKFFSLISLSNFLDSTEYATYKDYLDENWDRDYEEVLELRIPNSEYAPLIASKIPYTDILSVDETIPKKTREQIEGLTKDEILYIIKQELNFLTCSKASVGKKLDILLKERSAPSSSKSPLQVMNQLALFLSKALVQNESKTIQNYSEILLVASELISNFSARVPSDIKHVSASELSYKELEPVVDFLVEHAQEFSLDEAAAIIFSFDFHKIAIRSGSLTDYFSVLNKALEKEDSAHTVNIFKFITDLVLANHSAPPTYKELLKAVESDALNGSSAVDLTLMLISNKVIDDHYMPDRVRVFREVFKPKARDARS